MTAGVAGVLVLVLGGSGCAAGGSGAPSESATQGPRATPTQQATPTDWPGPLRPTGTPTTLVQGLAAPWSVVRLADGSALISERDTARILEYTPTGTLRTVTTVEGVNSGGEGGLLGLATLEAGEERYLYAYYTTASDNRIVRMPLHGSAGGYEVGGQEQILTGLASSRIHNGGRIAFGPDGKLYATVGDASQPQRAQEMSSLNGKILRMNPDGSVPADNPFEGLLIYSLGHRNPQGIAWDSAGQLWASEFGQNTWDELNRIEPGMNYGWPLVEGRAGEAGYVDPVFQWTPSEASPSGLAFVRGTFFLAALRGQRLWAVYPDAGGDSATTAWFTGEYGRLRAAVPGPDGSLWILTNNTDGRGNPRPGDDRMLQVALTPEK